MPISWTRAGASSSTMASSAARAAVGPIRSVQNVLEMKVDCAACMTSSRPITAVMAYPLPSVLPKVARSGSTP